MLGRVKFVLGVWMCCSFGIYQATAQQNNASDKTAALNRDQDSLIRISTAVLNATENTVRFEQNALFIKTLVNALKTPGSFNFGFDSLKNVAHVVSPDKAFKIFSWYVPTNEGGYRFFGAIQLNSKDGQLKLFPLIDETGSFKDTNLISDNKKWFGARYYAIVPVVNSGKQTYYALLGWKGNTSKTTKKVIEILSFNNGLPVFGKAVFEGLKGTPMQNRVVFEYHKLNSMTLRLDKVLNMIVFDHLVPFDPAMVGNFEYYASDSTFDAYRLLGGKLKFVENVEPKNDPDAKDELYIDPKNKNIPATRKF